MKFAKKNRSKSINPYLDLENQEQNDEVVQQEIEGKKKKGKKKKKKGLQLKERNFSSSLRRFRFSRLFCLLGSLVDAEGGDDGDLALAGFFPEVQHSRKARKENRKPNPYFEFHSSPVTKIGGKKATSSVSSLEIRRRPPLFELVSWSRVNCRIQLEVAAKAKTWFSGLHKKRAAKKKEKSIQSCQE